MDSIELARRIRKHALRMTSKGGSSHIGAVFSMADIVAVLYADVLDYDVADPRWANRDRFILSKGHAGAGIYAALADTTREKVISEFGGQQFSVFKPALAELAVERLAPIAGEMRRISADQAYVDGVLRDGARRASVLAEATMKTVRDIIGLLGD